MKKLIKNITEIRRVGGVMQKPTKTLSVDPTGKITAKCASVSELDQSEEFEKLKNQVKVLIAEVEKLKENTTAENSDEISSCVKSKGIANNMKKLGTINLRVDELNTLKELVGVIDYSIKNIENSINEINNLGLVFEVKAIKNTTAENSDVNNSMTKEERTKANFQKATLLSRISICLSIIVIIFSMLRL